MEVVVRTKRMPHALLRPAGITDGIGRTDMVWNGNRTAYHYWPHVDH